MSKLTLPNFQKGMVVVTPTSRIPLLTEDKHYIIHDIENDWLMITDDSGDTRYYKSHIFIEADVYYTMLLYLTLVRLFDFNPNQLK